MVEGDKTENILSDSNFDIIRETSCLSFTDYFFGLFIS